MLIANRVPLIWGKIDNEEKKAFFKNLVLEFAIQMDLNNIIQTNLIRCVATIVLFEWPEEWKEFVDLIGSSSYVTSR